MKIRAFAIASVSVLGVAACSPPAADTAAKAEAPAADAAATTVAAGPGAPAATAADPAIAAALATDAAGTFTGLGTEPFWELKVVPGQALNVTVGGEGFDATGPYVAPVIGADGTAVITTGNLVVTVFPELCYSVGPRRYPYAITVVVDGAADSAMKGCVETPSKPGEDIAEGEVPTDAK
jgi:uncharacterized membrane protein